jgi:hypothetical protein
MRTILLISAAFLAAAGSRTTAHDSRADADGFVRDAHLAPYVRTGADQLRIWSRPFMYLGSTGFVVTKGTIVKVTFAPDGSTGKTVMTTTRRAVAPSATAAILDVLPSLEEFNETETECGVDDGGEILIDGLTEGRRLVFLANNPDLCSDPLSAKVASLWATVSEYAGRAL